MKSITSEEFYEKLESCVEGKAYLELIRSQKEQPVEGEVQWRFEFHHIHPRGLGGTNQKENLVKLSVYEHCLAHLYLAKIFPCLETYYPLNRLSGQQFQKCSEVEQITLEQVFGWSQVRNNLREYSRGNKCKVYNKEGQQRVVLIAELEDWEQKGYVRGLPEEARKHLSEIQKGRKLPKEWVQRIQDSRRGYRHSEETKQKIGKKLKGRVFSKETLEKMSAAKKGKPGNRKGSHPSEETKQKLREIHLGKPNLKNRGKIYVSKNKKVIKILPEELEQYQKDGWLLGKKG